MNQEQLLSKKVTEMEESATIAMSAKSRALAEEGIDVISLSLGEPDFETPEDIKTAIKASVDNDYSHYTPVNGLLEVRKSVSDKFKRDNKINYTPNQIVLSTGAKQSLWNLVAALINEGDEVILPTPYWVSYEAMVEMNGGKVIKVATDIEDDFKMTPQQFESAITERTKLMIFSSPCNPSGSVYTESELAAWVPIIEKHPNLMVVADEIYEHINFTEAHASLASFDSIYDQIITINGVSKGFAMTGYRIGVMAGPEWLAKACTKLQGQITSGTNATGQKGAQAAFEKDPKELEFMKAAFLKRRDLVLQLLNKVPGLKTNVPQGAFYIFPDVSEFFGKKYENYAINNADDLAMFLLEKGHVATVSGDAFGAPKNIRLSYATSEAQLTEACTRIKNTLNLLK